jgi:energy-coupling factor transporter ATP-binding protein EcfA2
MSELFDVVSYLRRSGVAVVYVSHRLHEVMRIADRISVLRDGGWIPTRSATPSTALVPQRKAGFPIPNAGLLLGFQGTKTARREGNIEPLR